MEASRRMGRRAKGKEPQRPFQMVIHGANTPMGQQIAKYVAQYIPEELLERWAIADMDAIPLTRLHVLLEKYRYGPGGEGEGIGALPISRNEPLSWKQRLWSTVSKKKNEEECKPPQRKRRADGKLLVDDSDPYDHLLKKRRFTLDEMCQMTVLVLNCSNDDSREELLEACLAHDVDYVDLCMEHNTLCAVKEQFHERAVAQGLFIVQGCVYSTVCLDAALMLAEVAKEEMTVLEDREGSLHLQEVSCFCGSSDGPSLVVNGPAGRGVEGGMAVTKSRPCFSRYHDIVGQWTVKCSSVEEEILQWSWMGRGVDTNRDGAARAVSVNWSVASDSLVDSLWIYVSLLVVYILSRITLFRALLAYWMNDRAGETTLPRSELFEAKVVCTFACTSKVTGRTDVKDEEKEEPKAEGKAERDQDNNGQELTPETKREPKNSVGDFSSLNTCATLRTVATTSTAVAAVACCLCLLHDRRHLLATGGWQTPTNAFGRHLVDRLEMAGVDITTGTTPPPPMQTARHFLSSAITP